MAHNNIYLSRLLFISLAGHISSHYKCLWFGSTCKAQATSIRIFIEKLSLPECVCKLRTRFEKTLIAWSQIAIETLPVDRL